VVAEAPPPPAPPDAAPRAEKDKKPPPRESAATHLARAATFRKKGDKIQERVEIQKALEVDPDNAQARYLLGELALADGNKDLACKHLKRALRQGLNKAKPLYEKAECDLVGP
jgi:Tfp pilus assembly protein PilF